MQASSERAHSATILDPSGSSEDLLALTVSDFLSHLHRLGVEVHARDGKLILNAPTGAITAELQGALRARKQELITELERITAEPSALLTFAQQRLWLIDRITPGTVAYNIPQSWIVDAAVDREALQRAIIRLANRHSALRTRFEVRSGEPLQIVSEHVEIPLEFTDLVIDANAEAQEERLSSLLNQEGRRAFDLMGGGPLIRFHLFRLAQSRYLVFYNIHHIIADQWSLEVLQRDLAALYTEEVSGQPSNLPNLALQYIDIAKRERSDAIARLHANQVEYWRKRLHNVQPILELPFSKPRPAEQREVGETLILTIDSDLTRRLRQLASRSGTSLYLLMLSVFTTLLYRYTGQKDLCIGTPITGRKLRNEEDLIGLVVNMLPLRLFIEPSETFTQLLQRTASSVLEDIENGDIPFQKLVTKLHPQRSAAYSPLFQVMFALNARGGEATTEQRETFIGISKFDLTLQISEQAQTLNVYFEYRTELFAREDIEDFSRHLVRIAESIADAPESEVRALPLLDQHDRDSISHWNVTDLAFDRDATLIDLFEDQVTLHPGALALCCGDALYTYRELHHRVVQLATSLQSCGVKPRCFVGICLDRTPDLIVSILAVLKSRAAYLPLDPKYPEERLAFMLDDSGAQIMLARRTALSERLANNHPQIRLIDPLEANVVPTELQNHAAQFVESAPDDPAYLIYTSGSTGKPKGVVVEQRNATALIAWAKSFFDAESIRGILAATSVCFDLSIFEIFLPLSTGNTVVLVNDVLELPRSPHVGFVTMINTVPSAMSALVESGIPSTVRTVCMAGEFLPTELVDRVYACGAKQVFDLYGPTETTTYSTAILRMRSTAASIGKPISNTRIYLLDENLMEVPPGALGEIFIAGEGVTRGYLNRPELTDERYLDRFSIDSRSRLYRTGDLARQLSDGSLVYLGRRDQQIKLRGHRIELGEVESALREVSGASEVAAVVQKHDSGEMLVAFAARNENIQIDPAACITALRERLPAYMVPSIVIPIQSLPLTPNGKIDRRALAAATDLRERTLDKAVEVPRDLLEQWIANIWFSRLRAKEISRTAHFFDDLGGHSLVAFEIFAEIEKRLGVALMLATLFQAPTVESLAVAIRRKEWMTPQHITFAKPGPSQTLIYYVSDRAENSQVSLEMEGRVMTIDLQSVRTELDSVVREIAAIEASRPTIVLVATSHHQEAVQQLASGLTRAGFKNVSVSRTE